MRDDIIHELWWVQVVRGISAIVFGILLLAWPGATIGVLAFIFAALFAVYGVMDILSGVQGLSKGFASILQVLLGVLELGIVVVLFRNAGSGLTLAVMGLLMAVNLIVMAIVMIATSFISDVSAGYRWAVGLIGIMTLLVGISVARAPVIGLVSVITVLGIFGLITGPIDVAAGLMLRRERKELQTSPIK